MPDADGRARSVEAVSSASADDRGREYLDGLRARFAAAAAAAGDVPEIDLLVGRDRLRLRFAGPALVPVLLPAFAAVAPPDAAEPPFATIELWDSASTGVGEPPRPWNRGALNGRSREVIHLTGEHVKTLHDPDWEVVMAFDELEGAGSFWAPSDDAVPWYERAAPLRPILHWCLTTPRRHLLHGAAVGVRGRAVLLVGPSGSGKSTTAVRCVQAGYDYLGDDYVVFDAEPEPTVHALYRTAKLSDASLAAVPGAAATVIGTHPLEPKSVLDLGRMAVDRLRPSATVAAVVVPTVVDADASRLQPIDPADALRALAPSTILQLPHQPARVLAAMAQLVRTVPTFGLALGRDGDRIPRLLEQVAT